MLCGKSKRCHTFFARDGSFVIGWFCHGDFSRGPKNAWFVGPQCRQLWHMAHYCWPTMMESMAWPWKKPSWRRRLTPCSLRFSALHGMLGVLERCLSVCQTRALWQNGKKICPDFYTIRKIIYLSFMKRRMADGRCPLLSKILGHHRWSEIADFEPILARSASAVTPSEKSSINTYRMSTTRFPMKWRWPSYVERKTAVFGVKSHFAWGKSATKFLCVKTVSDKVVRHSLA